jgi:hypothetical protein
MDLPLSPSSSSSQADDATEALPKKRPRVQFDTGRGGGPFRSSCVSSQRPRERVSRFSESGLERKWGSTSLFPHIRPWSPLPRLHATRRYRPHPRYLVPRNCTRGRFLGRASVASSAWDEDEDGERGRSISLILTSPSPRPHPHPRPMTRRKPFPRSDPACSLIKM